MTKNVLLTGGFGTLGGRLAQLLAEDSQINLRLASRYKQSSPSWAPSAETFEVNFENSSSINEMLTGITHVVHLVALNDSESRADSHNAQRVNVEYTTRVVEACKPKTRFVYLSTIQVYGSSLVGLINENTAPQATDPYAQTHLDAEVIVSNANRAGKIEGLSLRSANGFGAPMTKDAKIWQIIANDLCRQAVVSKKLTLKSHGMQYRNFLPFTDTCLAIKHGLFLPPESIGDGIFNLGSQHTLKVLEMAELIAERCAKVLGFKPKLEVLGAKPESEPSKFVYDSTKLQNTGLELNTQLEVEIDRLLRACKDWFGANQ